MSMSYDVRVWKTDVYEGKRTTTHWVQWSVAGKRFKKPFKNAAGADSFRSELVTASRKGEAFDVVTGLPLSMQRTDTDMPWYEFACKYVDMKWPDAAATYRRSIAEALVTATCAMLATEQGKPAAELIRSALLRWGFNTQRRDLADRPVKVADTLRWVARNTRNVSTLADPLVLRPLMNALARKLNGKAAAASVVNRKRAVLSNALEYAIELKLLDTNPIPALKWRAPKITHAVDRRSVVNPVQARTLLNAVRDVKRSGRRLHACFACSYYAALRPEEAVNLRKHNIKLPPLVWNKDTEKWEEPTNEWGEFHLEKAAPHAGKEWTDNGRHRDERGLKHRAPDAVRVVPIPPELVPILRAHLDEFGTDAEGRLFFGERGGEIPVITYTRMWQRARGATFAPDVLASPLARTPYDLRHACVSTWLNAGVDATRVAEWAGHSVEVLLKVYAKCLDGQDEAMRRRVEAAMR